MSPSDPVQSDYDFNIKDCYLGAQMLFVAFGALVLVPILTGLDSNVALFTAGAGTLIFQAVTKGKVPVFLASSFALLLLYFERNNGAIGFNGQFLTLKSTAKNFHTSTNVLVS